MPKFMITTADSSKGAENSDEMLDFPHAKAATDDAQVALGEMVRDAMPDGKAADFSVKVRNAGGKEIYRASVSFAAKNETEIDRDDAEADAAADEVVANLGMGSRGRVI